MNRQKSLLTMLALAVAITLQSCAALQNAADNGIDLAQRDKELKGDIRAKASKQARKEAKRYSRDGWYTQPGALPVDKQIEKAWMRQYEEDEQGFPRFLVSSGNSVAESQSAAKLQATELAKLELAGLMQSSIAALIENSIANNQLNAEEAASVTETVAASKNIIAQEIGRVIVLTELYRKVGKANVEANVRLAYNSDEAVTTAKNVMREELRQKTEVAHEKLEQLLDW